MTDEEIIEMAKQAGIDMSDRKKYTDYSVACANILLITFARLITAKQIEIDAGICEAEEPWGNDADAWASTCLRRAAKAIRSQT